MYSSMQAALNPNSLSKGQRYTPEVVSKLNELVEEHGFNWKLIGQKLGRLVKSFISYADYFYAYLVLSALDFCIL